MPVRVDDDEEAILASRSELNEVYYTRRSMLAQEIRNIIMQDLLDALRDIKDVLQDIHEELKP